MSYITYSVNFNGNELMNVTGLTVLSTNAYKPGKRSLTTNVLARSNKSKVNSAFYTERDITVRVGITRATRDLVETSLDTLMSLIQGREKDLILRQGSTNRKYTATLSDTQMVVEGGSYIELELIFATSDHYGYDTNDTLLLQVSGFTSAQKTDQITLLGSAEWQAPKITITFTAISGGASKVVSLGNDGTGQRITITRTWVAGDVLEVDTLNQTVKVNGTEVAFAGALPEFALGVGYLTYGDTFTTSRTFSMTVNYKKRYA